MTTATLTATEQRSYGMFRSACPTDSRPETPVETTTPLDAAMNKRRVELGLEWDDLAKHGEVSDSFLRGFRKGRKGARDLTKAKLEDALKWQRGSIDAILAGGQPEPADEIPTIGELLVRHGVIAEDELTELEDIRDDHVVELLASEDMTEQAARDFLTIYMTMRRRIFGRE